MLEPARKATVPAPAQRAVENAPPAVPAFSSAVAVALPPPIEPARSRAPEPVPPIGGPSLLGLDDSNSVDIVREQAFTSLESYDGGSRSRGARLVLFLVLLAALGGAYWWVYTNYLRVADGRKPAALPTSESSEQGPKSDSGTVATNAPSVEQPLPIRSATRAPAPVVIPEPPAKKGTRDADKQVAAQEATLPSAAQREVTASRVSSLVPAADNGDALFRQGERYLYGRGVAQNCTNALKYMKMASDKQNAKARSAMGTMYATGHCVSRDLPSAYRWFALSLRADPNNGVVEKNLSAVWNQMTLPERQLATRSQ